MYSVRRSSYVCTSLYLVENAYISQSSFSASSCILATLIITFLFLFSWHSCSKALPEKYGYTVGRRRNKTHCVQTHFRGWEQKIRAQAQQPECFWRACRHNTSKHLKDKTTISSAQKASCQIQTKMSVRPNLGMCMHAGESQKISTNVTIHSSLIYRPQRPRTWLSDLFCANCDISDSHQELSICFGSVAAPSYVGGRNFRFTPT